MAVYYTRVYLLRALYIYVMRARAYNIVLANCQQRVYRYFFYRKNSRQYPTPPMSPKHHLFARPKSSVMQSTRNPITVVTSGILLY